MTTTSIISMAFHRLSPEAELRLVLFFFLFPAIWGGALAIAAIFQDLKRVLGKATLSGRKGDKYRPCKRRNEDRHRESFRQRRSTTSPETCEDAGQLRGTSASSNTVVRDSAGPCCVRKSRTSGQVASRYRGGQHAVAQGKYAHQKTGFDASVPVWALS